MRSHSVRLKKENMPLNKNLVLNLSRAIVIILIALLATPSYAQLPQSNQSIKVAEFQELALLIKKGSFQEAALILNSIVPQSDFESEQSAFYEAKLALAVDKSDTRAISFFNHFPGSQLASKLALDIADFYFLQTRYDLALLWYRRSDSNSPTTNYRRGYAYYSNNQPDSARLFLSRVPLIDEEGPKAHYYLGVILWPSDPNQAISYFDRAAQDESMAPKAAIYQARYHFDKKAYLQAIKLIDSYVDQAVRLDKFSLLLIRGLAYYHLKRYKSAISDLDLAWSLNAGSMPDEALYALAIAYLSTNQGDRAVKSLRYVATGGRLHSQNASFQLGQWYVSQENYPEAIAAFQLARNGQDETINQEALFLQAKCEFKENRFEQAISLLEDFQTSYPHKYRVEVVDLLTSAYYQSSDYDKTLAFIESSKSWTPQTRKIYQEVAYRRGLLLFNDQQMQDAISYFKKSLQNPVDKGITTSSQLYAAESYAYIQEYAAAIPYYNQVIKADRNGESLNIALYGIGYAYYNQSLYAEAIPYFERLAAREGLPRPLELELNVRIADCYFVKKEFDKAINIYRRLTKSRWAAYSYYQLANAYDLKEAPESAITYLIPFEAADTISAYSDDALVLLGQIRTDLQRYSEAIKAFDQLINTIPESPLLADALLSKGLATTNAGNYSLAEQSYQQLITGNPSSPLADDALLGLQSLTEKGHQLTDFERYYELVSTNQPDNSSLNSIAFERAKGHYFQQQYQLAINSLDKFLLENPLTTLRQQAWYYLGDSYFRLGQWSQSIEAFDNYLQGNPEDFYTRVLDRRGRAALELGDTQLAEESFNQLAKNAGNDRDAYQAKFGLLQVLQSKGDYEKVVELADELLAGNWKPVSAESQLSMIKSEAFLKLNNTQQATDELIKIMNGRENETNASAHYQLALIQAEEGNLAMSNETLIQLISNYGSYERWKNLAYLQLIRNYITQNNELQARATVLSIVENSKDSILVSQAEGYLKQLDNMKETKTDSTQQQDND